MQDAEYAEIVAAWQLGPPQQIVIPDSGTVNAIVKVTLDGRDYFLRAYRHPERAPQEHDIIAHARARSFPAVGPVPLHDGTTLLDRGGRRYALFLGATGRQYPRNALTAAATTAMGMNLAALHHALEDYPHTQARRTVITLDHDTTLTKIAHLEQVIRHRDGTDPRDSIALERLASRRDYLQRTSDKIAIDQAIFSEQVIHGDYQETNLFFNDDGVCAVIDWDQAHLRSRVWEIMRVLDFVYGFAPAPCSIFLNAYRAGQPLAIGELDRGAAAYSQIQTHNLWVYEAYYLESNERVGQFIHPGGFVPPAERWAQLRPYLGR